MLNGCPILVVEDQAIIGLALAAAIRNADGKVVGPAASVKAALGLLDKNIVAAAVLDITLADGTVAPVIERLVEQGIPIIVQSGVGLPSDLAIRFPDIVVLIKPTIAAVVNTELAKLLGNHAACAHTPSSCHDAPSTAPAEPLAGSGTALS